MRGDGEKILAALAVAFEDGQTDGAHHKMWVIDQMVRKLCGDHYEEVIKKYKEDVDGTGLFTWDEGIAP